MITKYLLAAGALVVAGVPAVLGTVGNASFARDVPVRVPDQVNSRVHSPRLTPTSSPSAVPGTGDHGVRHAEPRDDRSKHAEPGDDRGHHVEPGDDRGHDGATHSGRDDHGGSGGHGSDDN